MGQSAKGGLTKKHIVFILMAYCAYVVYAFYFNGYGANASVMMEHYQITSAQQGFILTMQSIGGLAAAIYLSLHGERYNKVNVIGLGILFMGIACLAIGFAPPYTGLILLVILGGVGYTSIDVMLNSLIPEMYPKQKNTVLPIAHAFFGAGAMITPLLVTRMVNPDTPSSFAAPFMLIGILSLIIFLIYLVVSRRVIPETPYADMAEIRKQVSGNPAEIFKTKKAWMFLVAGIFYFSFQTGLINWLPSYCLEIGLDFSISNTMLTAFFVGSLVMRFVSPLILKRIDAARMYILFGIISVAAITLALFMTNPTIMMVLIVINGFMQGSCVALLVLMSTAAFPHRVASASSLTFIAVNIGMMTAPLWMGEIAKYTGYKIPLLLGCACLLLSVVMVAVIQATGKKQRPVDAN
ncbi:MFS transporter [Christensenellaceae bacterium OttesenSCG-928-K19]|nr:MFS transporter [Christensenellaceae bacterium OttesenSCG-928-K19]